MEPKASFLGQLVYLCESLGLEEPGVYWKHFHFDSRLMLPYSQMHSDQQRKRGLWLLLDTNLGQVGRGRQGAPWTPWGCAGGLGSRVKGSDRGHMMS